MLSWCPLRANLLPKVNFEIFVSAIPVETIVEKVRSILYIGHKGDGKFFVYDVENAIRISTGNQGYDALQDAVL
ncbi:MAG: P-II family nitrogen regulator [Erysipelotrichaceae bacterium]